MGVAANEEGTEPSINGGYVEVITYRIAVTDEHGHVTVVSIPSSFPHSCLIIRYLIIVTRRLPLVEQKLLPFLREHLSPPR